MVFDWIIVKLPAMILALHNVLKSSTCVTKSPKIAGDLSRYAGDWEKGLKILRLPPNVGQLTAMLVPFIVKYTN